MDGRVVSAREPLVHVGRRQVEPPLLLGVPAERQHLDPGDLGLGHVVGPVELDHVLLKGRYAEDVFDVKVPHLAVGADHVDGGYRQHVVRFSRGGLEVGFVFGQTRRFLLEDFICQRARLQQLFNPRPQLRIVAACFREMLWLLLDWKQTHYIVEGFLPVIPGGRY